MAKAKRAFFAQHANGITMHDRIERKLGFVWHTLHPKKTSIYVNVFETLREKGTEPLIIQRCKLFVEHGTHFTDALLSQEGSNFVYIPILKSARAALEEGDRKYIHFGASVI